MNVFYRPYKLTPLKALNRFSSQGIRSGVHLKVKKRFTEHFADYFPHEILGDRPVELFLEKFKFQENEYSQKVFYFLLNEEKIRSQRPRPYQNHQLWNGQEAITTPVVKYKLRDEKDFTFLKALEKKHRMRLDANGLFGQESIKEFINQIPKELLVHIEYLEDPLIDKDWSNISLPLARDFIDGDPFKVLIHKPNCRFLKKTEKKVVFSSYMGSDLGRWHAYCELLEKGDLSEFHGINTPGLYAEERTNLLNEESVLDLYNELSFGEWKLLCSI